MTSSHDWNLTLELRRPDEPEHQWLERLQEYLRKLEEQEEKAAAIREANTKTPRSSGHDLP